MKVAAVQHDVVWEDRTANFERLAPQIAAAAGTGARLVVLTEMYSTGFSLDIDAVSEPVDGPSTEFLADQARRHGVWVCGSLPERTEGGALPSNTLVLAGPDGERHRYRKIHPFSYAREHERYTAGDRLVTVEVEGLRVSLFVCYDLRFADEFWGLAPTTDLYLVPANWPEPRRFHWMALLQARAIENQAYVVAPAQGGVHPSGRRTHGHSMIVDPWGTVLACRETGPGVVIAPVKLSEVARVRTALPALSHRRLEGKT